MFKQWLLYGKKVMHHSTLGQRIIIAFAIIMTSVTLFYTSALYYNFKWVEFKLSGEHMADQLHAKEQALANGVAPQVNPGVYLFGSHPDTNPIPAKFMDAPLGFSERDDTHETFFLYREIANGYDFLLAKDTSEFEELEQIFYRVVLIIALIFSIAGIIWGMLFYRIVMDPLKKLTKEVTEASHSDHYRPLKKFPLRDDITTLAECCDAALRRLHEALEREQNFSGDVSHEIRNPLNVIKGSLELLEDSNLTERQRRQVERAQKAANDIHLLVEDFLTFAHDVRSFGASASNTIPAMFERMREIWTPEAKKRRIEFKTMRSGECQGVYSMVLLGSVMNNLIRNAIHYTTEGAVVLEETSTGFTVTDNAGGIDPEEMEAIFQPFYRGRAAAGKDGAGYGIGLSIVIRVCNRCHWTIQHENVPGGSRFVVTLKPDANTDPSAGLQLPHTTPENTPANP